MKDSKELALQIADFLYSKKGENIQVLDVPHLTSIAEYFILCSARNTTQCRTMAEDLEDKLTETDEIEAGGKEGYREWRWIVLDYASVIVPIVHEQERE